MATPLQQSKPVRQHKDKRPFDPVLADEICESMTRGESLSKVLERIGISPGFFYRWLAEPGFREDYANARKVQAEIMATEIIQIADDSSTDTYIDENGRTRVDPGSVARARLRVDTRKWILSKVLPKVYGDKVALTDSDGQNLKVDLSWLKARAIGQGHQDKPMTIDMVDVDDSSMKSTTYVNGTADVKSPTPESMRDGRA